SKREELTARYTCSSMVLPAISRSIFRGSRVEARRAGITAIAFINISLGFPHESCNPEISRVAGRLPVQKLCVDRTWCHFGPKFSCADSSQAPISAALVYTKCTSHLQDQDLCSARTVSLRPAPHRCSQRRKPRWHHSPRTTVRLTSGLCLRACWPT